MACAMGCSEPDSTAAARRSSSSRVTPSAVSTCATDICPVVMVPVLSNTTVSTRRARSSTCGPRITVPSWAPRPVPTMRADGVASPSAHGQAMIRTAMAADSDMVTPLPTSRWPARVSAAITSTIGTKTPETLSARRCTSAFPVCASSTMAAILASCDWAPTAVARTTSRPVVLTDPPTTRAPGSTSTGSDSPVITEASTAERPSTTSPSAATFSPGRTTTRSPTRSAVASTRRSSPSTSTLACLAPTSSSARSAAPDSVLARASM